MYKRPVLVSILGGYLSLFSVASVLSALKQVFLSDDPVYKLDPGGNLILSSIMPMVFLISAVIGFVCAVNILEGVNWARWLYTVVCLSLIIYELIAFANYSLIFYVGIVSRLVMIIVLFLPNANDFFKQPD